MKKLSLMAVMAAFTSFTVSCTPEAPSGASGVYTDLHLILNEGPFGSGSASITAYSEDTLIQNAFSVENGFPLSLIHI